MSVYKTTHAERMAPFAGVPGPEPTFPAGNAGDFLGKFPWEVLADYGRRYGGLSVFYLAAEPILLVQDAALVEQVLDTDRHSYYKDAIVRALKPVLTESSPNIANGADWARKRKDSPLMHDYARGWLAAQAGPFAHLFGDRLAALAGQTATAPVAFLAQVQRIIFDAFSIATVGSEIGDEAYADFLTVATAGSHRMLDNLPVDEELEFPGRQARTRWHAVFAAALEKARAHPDPRRTDLVSLVVRMGTPLPDEAFIAELGNVFFGGDFSVPSTLVTAAWCLTHFPDEARKLRAALAELPDEASAADLESCVQLDRVLREAMRYRAAVPFFDRRVRPERSATLGGLTLPPNTHIFISNWLLHADPRHWPEPDRFNPERWTNDVAAANPLGCGHFFPFGGGPRMCMGMALAMFTMKSFLAALYRPYHVETGPGQPYDEGQEFFFGVRMPRGIKVRLWR